MWMVRAGEGGFLIDKFKIDNVVAIGWNIGDLSEVKISETIKSKLRFKYPDKTENSIGNITGQISNYLFEIDIGDYVVSNDSQNSIYYIGKITSDYYYQYDYVKETPGEYADIRQVEWLGAVKVQDLSKSTKKILEYQRTVFEIKNLAADELLTIINKFNNPKLRIIEDQKEISDSQEKFLKSFNSYSDDLIPAKFGYQGGNLEANAQWSDRLGIWLGYRDLDNRYWNAFGTEKPKENSSVSIVCEINFPKNGIDRKIAGAFAKDDSGNIYVVHRGKIGGGKKGMGKELIKENYQGNWVKIQDGDVIKDFIIIGRLSDHKLPEELKDFVIEIDRIKKLKNEFQELNLRNSLENVLLNYESAKESQNDGFKKIIEGDIPNILNSLMSNNSGKYLIKSSTKRMGNWLLIPYVTILNPKITGSPQKGYYPVYLFREDMQGVYLSLNQGATEAEEKAKSIIEKNKTSNSKKKETINILSTKAVDLRQKLENQVETKEFQEDIDLGIINSNKGEYYEAGNIYSKYYPKNNLPSEKELESDLNEILELYDLLVGEGDILKIIENPQEIKEAEYKFRDILIHNADEIIDDIYWSNDLGIGFRYTENDKNNKYFNGFGIVKPDANVKMSVFCEINIGKNSLNKNTGGAFAKDLRGNLYVIHRGNIAGINRTEFFDKYKGEMSRIQDGNIQTDAIIISSLNNPNLPEDVKNFVFEVAQIKGLLNEYNTFTEYLIAEGFYFEPETIENFLLSLKAKPFVILTGNSGTGKTKIAQLFSEYLKLKNLIDCHKIVPVGANWTENRHIVGFYNVITKEYMISETLELLLEARKFENEDKPFFLILDEMNLSHVERYFSDFLSAMESNAEISLHKSEIIENENSIENVPKSLKIPENLFVIGTVNVDETTYMFSPKVLDRANVIEFSTISVNKYMLNDINQNELKGNVEYIENPLSNYKLEGNKSLKNSRIKDLKEYFEDVESVNGSVLWNVLSEEMNTFQKELKVAGFDFGFRVIDEILRFMYVSWVYEGKPKVWENWMHFFDVQIKQKMLPKIHGSQRVIEPLLGNLFNCCYDGELSKPLRQLENIDFDPNIKYKESAKKIQEMDKVLYDQRYVSFIN